jgi:hypothetical protein
MTWLPPVIDDDDRVFERTVKLGGGYELRLALCIPHNECPDSTTLNTYLVASDGTLVNDAHYDCVSRAVALAMAGVRK